MSNLVHRWINGANDGKELMSKWMYDFFTIKSFVELDLSKLYGNWITPIIYWWLWIGWKINLIMKDDNREIEIGSEFVAYQSAN